MPRDYVPASHTRRDFLRRAALGAAALALPERILADPYAPLPAPRPRTRTPRGAPVRVRGRVVAAGRGVAGAAVTDGLAVVATDRDGRFRLVGESGRGFVTLSLPRGYAVPTSAAGTALLHRPIRADARGEMDALFELSPLPGGAAADESHAVLVLADPQTEDAYDMGRFHAETVPDVRGTVRALGDVPVVGVACGDIMYDRLELFPEYERAVAAMGVPFFQVVGNHDLTFAQRTDEGSTDVFERHFGPTYYSFDRGRVHYVVLDDVFWHGAGYLGYLTDGQLRWLAADLARVERGAPVVAFLHIPALGSGWRRSGERAPDPSSAVQNREALYRLLEPFRAHVVAGHMHECEHGSGGGVREHVAGAVCGGWWSGPICYDGAPNGYAVVEVRGEELRWRYKGTGLDAAVQLRAYAHGADPAAPDEIVANVWDWDPSWSVTWYEDGERRGAMSRRTGLDPLSVTLHAGPDRPQRRSWVDPMPTAHLFYAPASRAAREIRVEAADRWGRTYTAIVE